jgi:hypothetical protein
MMSNVLKAHIYDAYHWEATVIQYAQALPNNRPGRNSIYWHQATATYYATMQLAHGDGTDAVDYHH